MDEIVVVNKRFDSYDIYIGRGGPWGNPFTVQMYGRAGCIELFERWIRSKPELIAQAKIALAGKRLGCFCKPLACHGDILKKVVEE
jgi:hypothetical protein